MEAVHPQRPLQADQRALDAGQKRERHQAAQDAEHGRDQPSWQFGPVILGRDVKRDQNVADQEDGHVGGRIVGAVVVQILSAGRAMIVHLEISAKDGALPTMGTAAEKAAPY